MILLMYNKADVKSWLDRAKDDLRFAKSGAEEGFYPQCCFISQQVAEKALKALIYSKEPKFEAQELKKLRTHKLPLLLKKIESGGIKVSEDIKLSSKVLDRYYLPTRYPDIPDPTGAYTENIAKDALEKAREIIDFVETQLEK